jgi:hypothetical protein
VNRPKQRELRAAERARVPGGGRNERFPGFDVIQEADTWDSATSGVVLQRLGLQPDLRSFSPVEEAAAAALFDLLLAQREEPRVPVVQMVDARLAEGQTDGWRYEDMPEDGEAWHRSLAGLDEDARATAGDEGVCFANLSEEEQADIIRTVQNLDSKPWHGMPAGHVWSLWTRYACTAFYSHPWAWNEIGFGGPAYPRGYMRAGVDMREPWEVADTHPEDDPEGTQGR